MEAMSIALPVAPARPGTPPRPIARIAQTALAVIGLACVVAVVAFVRTFAFEYFHGDHTALQVLVRTVFGQ